MYIAGLHAGADWLRKKHPWHWKHTCPHIHTVTHIQMWGSKGGPPWKFWFFRPTSVHFKVFEGHKKLDNISFKSMSVGSSINYLSSR